MDYDRIQNRVERLIHRIGKPASIVRIVTSGPSYNPVTEEQAFAITLAETGYSLETRADTLVQTGDRVGVIATDGEVEPELADKIDIDGTRYSFVDLQPVNPGGTMLMYRFQARK